MARPSPRQSGADRASVVRHVVGATDFPGPLNPSFVAQLACRPRLLFVRQVVERPHRVIEEEVLRPLAAEPEVGALAPVRRRGIGDVERAAARVAGRPRPEVGGQGGRIVPHRPARPGHRGRDRGAGPVARPSRRRDNYEINRAKAKRRLARLNARIAAIRRDATHKATSALARRFARIGIEDLNVRGMARNRSLARSIMDGAFGEFRRQLAYKARMTGALVVVADRF